MNKKIFLVAGGSGGHLFPALSLIEELHEFDTLLLTDKRTEKYLKGMDIKYEKVITSKINKNILLIINLIIILLGISQNILLFLKNRPNLVIGFGGYTSIPSIIAAKILNIKIIIHEQNAVMGRTNKLLSKISDEITISFPSTKYAPINSKFTGIPIRKKKKIKKIISRKKRILVVGGSQGAKIFSEIIPQALDKLDNSTKKKIKVIQQVRNEDFSKIKKYYNSLGVAYDIKEFFDDIYNQIYNADLIISRCGASTLAEIHSFEKQSILFPLPTSMNNHQYFNAKEFQKNNNCIIYDEKKLNLHSFSRDIENLIFLEKKKIKLYNKSNNPQKISIKDLIIKVIN